MSANRSTNREKKYMRIAPTQCNGLFSRALSFASTSIGASKEIPTQGLSFCIEAHVNHPSNEVTGATAMPLSDDPRGTSVADDQLKLSVIEETLHIDKVAVDQGGFRVTKRVELQEQLVDELLRHERVNVERRPIGRAVLESDVSEPYYEGETLVVPVIEEVVVKRLMLVEEVRITRTHGTHQAPQQVTLRKEFIEIERLGAEPSVIRSSERPS